MLTVAWIERISSSLMVLFLMVMGNIPIVYQKGSLDASKKCTDLKKNRSSGFFTKIGADFLVEMEKDGLKTGVKSGVLDY